MRWRITNAYAHNVCPARGLGDIPLLQFEELASAAPVRRQFSPTSPQQDHGEHHEGSIEYEDDVQTITKEMDLEHLEHAGFDPEAAAFEDGNDLEDLGYDQDVEPGPHCAASEAKSAAHTEGKSLAGEKIQNNCKPAPSQLRIQQM